MKNDRRMEIVGISILTELTWTLLCFLMELVRKLQLSRWSA